MSVESLTSSYCPSFVRASLGRIERSPVGSRLAKGMFWVAAGAVISRGLMLAASVFVARMLGKTGYGELGMIRSTIGMFGVFAGFGLGLTATKHVAQFRLSDPDRAGRIIGLSAVFAVVTGGLMALVLFAFAPWLAAHTINAPHLAGPLRISALMLFIDALNGAQTGALAGFEAFRTIAWVNSLVGLISFPILLIGVHLAGLPGALWALTLNLAVNWLLNHLALANEARRHGVTLALRRCSRERGILWTFSLPAALSATMVAPVNWVCGALLVNRPDGYAEMGIFNAANQWYAMLLFLPGLLGSVVLPVLSDRLACRDNGASMKTLRFAIGTNAMIVLPLVLLASLASPYIMRLYGESFDSGWPTLVAILCTAGLVAVQTPVGQVIAAAGWMWVGLAMNLGWAAVFISLTCLFPAGGSLSIATARLAAYAFHAIWVFAFACHLLGIYRRNSLAYAPVRSAGHEEDVNINTRKYWDNRFATGDWEAKRGREQTRLFAETHVRHLKIPSHFRGTILDFGCGLGDAMPVYRAAYPYASLIGMDISAAAISRCRETYGDIASFVHGDHTQVPEVDVIIASNVLEHLSDDLAVAGHLLARCRQLYIIVPYGEELGCRTREHVNTYDEHHFESMGPERTRVFTSPGCSEYGLRLLYGVYVKNVFRLLQTAKCRRRSKEILFYFRNSERSASKHEG